ncbi:1-phosphofructokinase family hexose kinase [Novosphingobium sp.]|uniref:1-phosphofructokinase family hexose kinase n=1 Tax=Novosphingobium sp. TaxID=1874826 RepID=UPI0035B25018
MPRIATLTLNPAIDSACEAEKVFPTHKIRTFGERYDPGGGGINVARVLARLGSKVEVVYLSGGATGALLDELLVDAGMHKHRIAIHDHTRMSLAVFERATGQEFRFVPEGPLVSEGEWQAALADSAALDCDWLVASGSLPRGVPDDFFARLAAALAPRGVRLALDTSGPALKAALDAGGLALVKPSQGEFEALTGQTFASPTEIGEAAQAMVRAGKAAMIAVTLGHEGAVLAHADGVEIRPGAKVEVRSATGAGDSFVAGMVHALSGGAAAAEALRWGMACGTAAVLNPGTGLAHVPDIERMLALFA